MHGDDYRDKEGYEFFVLEIHNLPIKDETYEEMVNLIVGRHREYFSSSDAALKRSEAIVRDAERRGERVVCMIYQQKLIATVVNSDKDHLRIVK